jgi:leader peptidase (prepilin peptidase)/N-methyltransferase
MYLRYDIITDGLIYPAFLCLFLAGVIVIGFEDFDTQEMSVCVLVYLGILAFAARVLSVLFPKALRGNNVSVTDGLIGMFSISVPLLIIGFVITPLVYKLFISENHKAVRKMKKRLKKENPQGKEREKLEKAITEKLAEIKEQGEVYGFGMGDIIFMAAGGLMLGWKAAIVATFIAIILGAVVALVIKVQNAKKGETDNAFAFGPCLAVGLAAAAYYGTEIFDWYVAAVTFPQV